MEEKRSSEAATSSEGAVPSLSERLRESTWSITRPQIFDRLSAARTVLLAGCGGGYDVLSGLPLYFALRKEGKTVLLANLSFTDLNSWTEEYYCEACVRVTPNMKLKRPVVATGCPPVGTHSSYFPEFYLSRWFKEELREDVAIFTFKREIGVSQLSKAYQRICSDHSVDAVVLVDGGTDSLMFGYEEAMGTPVEDQTSIAAVSTLDTVPTRLLAATAFGVDSFHGVSHGLFLENVASLEKEGGYLGSFSVSQHSVEGVLFLEAYRTVSKCMQPSIVCASVTDAMIGQFGDYHSTQRTTRSKLFINPLMPIVWTFDAKKLANQIPYLDKLVKTNNSFDVMAIISRHIDTTDDSKIRKPIPLPM